MLTIDPQYPRQELILLHYGAGVLALPALIQYDAQSWTSGRQCTDASSSHWSVGRLSLICGCTRDRPIDQR